MDKIYTKGELLQLHTKGDEVVEGRFYGINTDKSRISLYSVKEKSLGEEGVCHYYDSEVREIVKLKPVENLENSFEKYLKISQKDCEQIIKTSKRYIYINQLDDSFKQAIDDLHSYSYIAVSSDGASMGRKCKMPFMIISTPHQIYIFDVQVMSYNAFDNGLKNLLESQTPKKIIHDCRKLSDCLYHKHNVTLQAIFDTQVGDILIHKNKTGKLPEKVKTLSETINFYLGLPLSTVNDKLDLVQCTERPLTTELKETLAKNICYLHRLSECINDQMLLPFVRGVECYVENMRSSDDFKAWELSGKINQPPKEFGNAIDY